MRTILLLASVCAACAGTKGEVRRAAAKQLGCRESEVEVISVEGDRASVKACRGRRAALVRDRDRWDVIDTHSSHDAHHDGQPSPVSSEIEQPLTLTAAQVRAGIHSVDATVAACQLPAGTRVDVVVKVRSDGTVEAVEIGSGVAPQLGSCVATALRAARFDKTASGSTFKYAFAF